MPTPIRAVVFDLDGLMFDTEALFSRVTREMLEARGKVATPEIMRAMIGRRAVEVGPTFKKLAALDEPVEELMAEARARFNAQVDAAVHPTPGLIALLGHLERLGLTRGVATSAHLGHAERLLRRHGFWDHFAFVLTAEDVTKGKPDPEIYLKAVERCGVPADSVLVLEDSPAGIAAARAAGTFAVGVPHEHSPADGLRDAHRIVTSLDAPALWELFSHD